MRKGEGGQTLYDGHLVAYSEWKVEVKDEALTVRWNSETKEYIYVGGDKMKFSGVINFSDLDTYETIPRENKMTD